MKRILALLFVVLSVLSTFGMYSALAASDFKVSGGVLMSYTGTSKNITIPEGVYYIADSVFEGNKTIESVNLNDTVIIGNKAFYGCESLHKVTVSENVKSCGAYAFYNTPFYKDSSTPDLLGSVLLKGAKVSGDFTVPSEVTSIAPYALYGNTKVTSVTLTGKVTEIGEGAFMNCTSLSSVSVSNQTSYIGAFAFEGTPWLKSQKSAFVTLGNGVLIKYNGSDTDVKIPDSVSQIASGAFYENTVVKKVTIPETVTFIGMRAFMNCKNLTTVNIPKSVKVIDNEAFANCTALTYVEIPDTVVSLGDSVFIGATSLKTAKVLTSADIPNGLFASCTSLEAVMIASETTRLGDYAFYNCKNLVAVSVPDTVEIIGDNVFTGTPKLKVNCNNGSYTMSYCKDKAAVIGDSNSDGKVNIRDATHIQKAVAGMVSLTFTQQVVSDADFSGNINVRDATKVQKNLAGI